MQGVFPAAPAGARQQRRLAAQLRTLHAAVLAAQASSGRGAAVNLARAHRLIVALDHHIRRLENQGILARPVAERMLALTASAEQELPPLRAPRGPAR